jgi:hypothetical protein
MDKKLLGEVMNPSYGDYDFIEVKPDHWVNVAEIQLIRISKSFQEQEVPFNSNPIMEIQIWLRGNNQVVLDERCPRTDVKGMKILRQKMMGLIQNLTFN